MELDTRLLEWQTAERQKLTHLTLEVFYEFLVLDAMHKPGKTSSQCPIRLT